MPNLKPKKPVMFVGSSTEAKDKEIPQAFRNALADAVRPILWWEAPQFAPATTTFAALCQAANEYEFGLFVLTPDDGIESRGIKGASARDNVLFELGLFLGALGSERVFGVIQRGTTEVKIPSDLFGVDIPRFELGDQYDLIASVRGACEKIIKVVKNQNTRKLALPLAREWKFDSSTRSFRAQLSSVRLDRERAVIGKRRLCLFARVSDPNVNIENDGRFGLSPVRQLPTDLTDDIPLEVPNNGLFDNVGPGDKVEARLLLVPEEVEINKADSLADALSAGCFELESMSYKKGKATCPKCGESFSL